MIGWQAIVASGCYLCASLVQGLMVLGNATYQPTAWQLMLLYWATLVLSLSVNTFISHQLPNIESLILILHTFGFFAILIPMVYFAPHGDAKEIFTSFTNGGMWPTDGISFLIGCLGPCFNLLGMSEVITTILAVLTPLQERIALYTYVSLASISQLGKFATVIMC